MTKRLRVALFVCLIVGSFGILAAELGWIGYTHFAYLAAENLLALSLVIALALGVMLRDSGEVTRRYAHPAYLAALTGSASAVLSMVFLLLSSSQFLLYEMLIALLMGISLGALSYVILTDAGTKAQTGEFAPPYLYSALVLFLFIGGLLRVIAPGSPILTLIVAPIVYFLLPGFALTFALLPDDARPLDHMVYAAPISIGAQFVAVAWCALLGIALSPLLFYVNASVITGIGFAIALIRQRRRKNA